jgi:hypothetical protein
MIDPSKESLLPLCKAARLLPSSRSAKGQHVSTLHRWARKGVRGVRLEVIRLGGTTCTSHEALGRFYAAQSCTDGAIEPLPEVRRERTKQVLHDGGLLTDPSRGRHMRGKASQP